MADGLCSGDPVGDVIEETFVKDYGDLMSCETSDSGNGSTCGKVNPFYLASASDKLFDKLCPAADEGFLPLPLEDDCRKKRCVDRYDSSESSDSGVAVLSCTDCSGSSTSSDITDPGSPFSTTSSHSEDSASQPATKMPPTQNAHHPPWPWTAEEGPPIHKRSMQMQTEKTALPKRLKSNNEDTNKSPPCLADSSNPSPKQGKITEYFKSQIKLHMINNKNILNNNKKKVISLVDQQTQFNGIVRGNINNNNNNVGHGRCGVKKSDSSSNKSRNKSSSHSVTVPRKILPAPRKIPADNMTLNHHHSVNNLANFASTVTLTAVTFPPNLAYIHTKSPKPPDNIFMPQFATISNDNASKLIPIINRNCLNVIHHQPVQKITTINNFNCVKLNATVVPIVKLNALPSRLNVETAVPTVLSVTPKVAECAATEPISVRVEPSVHVKIPPSADSDSGVSSALEISVGDATGEPGQKSPILSQPKTIRFPPTKREVKEKLAAQENGFCRWAECSAQFDTNGALLEHLQVKHVISQATQEHYVCLWLGCKVHGRTSCSRSWLERHVLAHAGTKPFRCIVDGCGQRFNSQLTLERHVNGHFNGDGSQTGSAKKSTESSSSKLFKRNGKKIRFRRQPWSARMFDFIDTGIMEGLQHKLLTMTQDRTLGQLHNPGDSVHLSSQILARRVETDGRVKFLVRWHPADIIPDEWMSEKEYVPSKFVPIPSLQPPARGALDSRLFPSQPRGEKRSRKHPSKQQT